MHKLTLVLTAALAALLVAAAACAGELDESLTSLKRGDCVRAPDQASADEDVSK